MIQQIKLTAINKVLIPLKQPLKLQKLSECMIWEIYPYKKIFKLFADLRLKQAVLDDFGFPTEYDLSTHRDKERGQKTINSNDRGVQYYWEIISVPEDDLEQIASSLAI